jgi:predicted GIY-YIG superfamily endonuclease
MTSAPCKTATWFVYLLRCRGGALYTGITTDVVRRFAQHRQGDGGAKYLRGRGPLRLVYERPVGTRGQALRLEHRIKRLSKKRKERLVATSQERGVLRPHRSKGH